MLKIYFLLFIYVHKIIINNKLKLINNINNKKISILLIS